MRTNFYKVFLILTGILFAPYISGQTGLSDLDSIAIIKPKSLINLYRFADNGKKVIQLGTIKTELVNYKTNPTFRDIGNGLMTALTGIGFSSSTDVNWKISGIIKYNDMAPDWIVSLFCEGNIEKKGKELRMMMDPGR